ALSSRASCESGTKTPCDLAWIGATMQTEPIIRRACVDDYEAVRRLFVGLDELHRERLPWLFQQAPASEARSPEFFRDILFREDSAVFVADAGGVIGLAHGLIRTAPEIPLFVPQRWGVLDSLAVDAGCRRRGVGRLLAQSFERWALDLGAAWVEVGV